MLVVRGMQGRGSERLPDLEWPCKVADVLLRVRNANKGKARGRVKIGSGNVCVGAGDVQGKQTRGRLVELQGMNDKIMHGLSARDPTGWCVIGEKRLAKRRWRPG